MEDLISKELLSLILGYEIAEVKDVMDNTLYFNNVNHGDYINLDTLGRLIKEKLKSMGYVINIYHHHDTVATSISDDGRLTRYSSPAMSIFTELESLIDALSHVAKEKGLLC